MAKGSIMLQIAVEQTFSAPVNDVPEVWTVVFAALDGQRTVVREIASEKSHAVMVMAAQNNVIVPALGISQDVATDVWLAFNDLRRLPSSRTSASRRWRTCCGPSRAAPVAVADRKRGADVSGCCGHRIVDGFESTDGVTAAGGRSCCAQFIEGAPGRRGRKAVKSPRSRRKGHTW